MSYHRSPHDIDINHYTYELPEQCIAKYPLPERDASRLLLYQKGEISQDIFRHLADHLPEGALLLFNNTRVIHARLAFRRPSGARIEVFCLEPMEPAGHLQSLSSEGPVTWKCLIGNNKRWKEEELLMPIETEQGRVQLNARRLGRVEDAFAVRFHWDKPGISFGELLHAAGLIPLPPYLQRNNTPEDERRYQTIYARHEGSVAAPTAGLHFTERVLQDLAEKNIHTQHVTLHVGAGTFRPVKSERLADHYMHEEVVVVNIKVLKAIRQALAEDRPVIPVGTTSLRTLESLYWQGNEGGSRKGESGRRKGESGRGKAEGGSRKSESGSRKAESGRGKAEGRSRKAESGSRKAESDHAQPIEMDVDQWAPYGEETTLSPVEALDRLIEALEESGRDQVTGQTRLLIAPGYQFRLAAGLITNFHQPRSTLLLLITALIGEDWRRVYDYALENEFRFLSYGDSSLLMP